MNTEKLLKPPYVFGFIVVLAIGVFIVTQEPGKRSSGEGTPCREAEGNKQQCWEEQITESLEKKGIAGAFDIVADLYAKEPEFAQSCHGFVHEIGKAAYTLFAKGREMELTPKTSYCGYGFYHGFMETLLLTSGNVQQAREFCAYVDEQLSSQAVGASAACFHGVGHGTVDGGDPRYWGNAQAMIAPGFEMCEKVAATDFQRYLCATGVFNSIEILSANPTYKLGKFQQDPFYLCNEQPEFYREPCYTNMIPAMLRLAQGDFALAGKTVEDNVPNDPDYAIRKIVLSGLFHEFIRTHLDDLPDLKHGVEICRSLKEPSRLPCIDGLSGGHMKYGKPGEEYKKALAFCSSDVLTPQERGVCFGHILSRLRVWYSPEKSKEICSLAEKQYQSLCSL